MRKKEIIELLDKEIKWCQENDTDLLGTLTDEFKKGFIQGLKGARAILLTAQE